MNKEDFQELVQRLWRDSQKNHLLISFRRREVEDMAKFDKKLAELVAKNHASVNEIYEYLKTKEM